MTSGKREKEEAAAGGRTWWRVCLDAIVVLAVAAAGICVLIQSVLQLCAKQIADSGLLFGFSVLLLALAARKVARMQLRKVGG